MELKEKLSNLRYEINRDYELIFEREGIDLKYELIGFISMNLIFFIMAVILDSLDKERVLSSVYMIIVFVFNLIWLIRYLYFINDVSTRWKK